MSSNNNFFFDGGNVDVAAIKVLTQCVVICTKVGQALVVALRDDVIVDHCSVPLAREGLDVASIDVDDVACGFSGEVRGEEISGFRDILG